MANWVKWNQPVLTSNTSYGTVSASSENRPAYYALNNNESNDWTTGSSGLTGWLMWELPYEIKITGITIYDRTAGADRPNITVQVYGDKQKTITIGKSVTFTEAGKSQAIPEIPADGVITDVLYFDCSSTQNYMGLRKIVIEAYEDTEADRKLIEVTPLIVATVQAPKIEVTPLIVATWVKNTSIVDETVSDVICKSQNKKEIISDLKLSTFVNDVRVSDANIQIVKTNSINGSSIRAVTKKGTVYSDSKRVIAAAIIEDSAISDMERTITCTTESFFDGVRKVTSIRAITSDTIRQTQKETWRVEDTTISDVVVRNSMPSMCYSVTSRIIGFDSTCFADQIRRLRNIVENKGDIKRLLPKATNSLDPLAISLSLTRGTLSDTFEIKVPYDMQLEELVEGELLDWPYRFLSYESSGDGLIRTITGMYDVDTLLYTPFSYYPPQRATAITHAKVIAKLLDKKLIIDIDDFTPTSSYAGSGATIQNIVGGLFGWASNLPQRWIHVLIRKNTLYIIQRGHEPNEIDITGIHHSRPIIDKKIIRSVWSGKGNTNVNSRSTGIEPLPFSGTITFGNAQCTYSNGLLISETMGLPDGTETTTYSYDSDGYVVEKVSVSPSATATTKYKYATTGNDKYLATETTTTVRSGGDESVLIVQHVYLGNGWYGTSAYLDGEFQSSSVSSGKPGGKANRYIQDKSNLNLGSKYAANGANLYGAALFDTSFPVKEIDMLKRLTKDIEWLNRKTEEHITLDIWQYNHLIDFTDRIKYEGKIYYLESNRITVTPREIKQTIEIVRWY